jgi:hypothetical protein
MPDTTSATHRRLGLALLLIGVLSIPAFCHGFLIDMDSYTQAADKLLRGGVLYRDTIDTKPPLIVLQYAFIFWLVGGISLAAVKLVTVAMLAASALLLRRIQLALFPDARRADLVVLLFVLGSFCGWGGDFLSTNTEIPANLFILLGVWGLVSGDFAFRPGRLFLAGLAIGVGFLYRYQAGAPLAAYVLLLFLQWRGLGKIVPRLVAVAAGFLVPVAVLVGYYAAIGALGDLLLLLKYDVYYMRGASIYWPAASLRLVTGAATLFQLLLLGGLEAAAIVGRRAFSRQNVFLLLYLGLSLATFTLGDRFFGHYLIASIPPLALLAAARLSRAPEAAPARGRVGRLLRGYERRAIAFLAAQVAVFWVINLAYYITRPSEPQYPDLARLVHVETTRDDRIFVWTTKTHLLLAVDRTYATRFVSNDFLVGRMYGTRHREPGETAKSAWEAAVKELWPILMSDLNAARPKLIVDDTPENSAFTLDHYPPLRAFVERNYGPCVRADGFCVYIRKTG